MTSGGLSGLPEQDAILAHAAVLCDGRIKDEIQDEEDLARDPNTSKILPYIVISFGEMYQSSTDRTLMDNGMQPHIMPVFFDCWGPDEDTCRSVASAVRLLFVPVGGWKPDPVNATSMGLIGGGSYRRRSAVGMPTMFCRTITMETTLNMSVEIPS